MQFQFLPVDERFYVRVNDDACARFPAGAFSTVSSYPVYAVRVGGPAGGQDLTEFLLPGSDAAFFWVDMRDTHIARR